MSIGPVHVTQNPTGRFLRLAAIVLAIATCLPAQQKLDNRQLYERLYVVVPSRKMEEFHHGRVRQPH